MEQVPQEAQEPYIVPKEHFPHREPYSEHPEPYPSPREPYVSPQEPYVSPRQPYVSPRVAYTSPREAYAVNGERTGETPLTADSAMAVDPTNYSIPSSHQVIKKLLLERNYINDLFSINLT